MGEDSPIFHIPVVSSLFLKSHCGFIRNHSVADGLLYPAGMVPMHVLSFTVYGLYSCIFVFMNLPFKGNSEDIISTMVIKLV